MWVRHCIRVLQWRGCAGLGALRTRTRLWRLLLRLLLLLLHRLEFVEGKVLQERGTCRMSEENAEHFVPGFREQFLRITRVGHWLAFLGVTKGFCGQYEGLENSHIINDTLESNVPQHCIGDIPHENPSDLENTFPLIRCPDSTAPRIVDRSQHFGHATEMTTNFPRQPHFDSLRAACSPSVNAKEEVNRSTPSTLLERFVEPLVTRIGGAPDLVLETLVYVILSVRLDDKVPCL